MKIPKYIEFHNETNLILPRYLKAVEPAEGCAILIGHKKKLGTDNKNNFWEIKHVWNCRNVWGQKSSNLKDLGSCALANEKIIQLSTENRFEIDAKDQIAAQKWSRENDFEVLCCAHSHPKGENKPSETDLRLHKSPGLMVISNNKGNLKAWWINNKFSFQRVKIEIYSLT